MPEPVPVPAAAPTPVPAPDVPVFIVGTDVYRPEHVLLAADLRGELAPAREALRADLAAERTLRARTELLRQQERVEDQPARAGNIRDEVNRWRMERDLVAAEECEAWLRARGLAVRDLSAHAARRVARRALEAAGRVADDALLAPGEVDPLLYAELTLGGAFERLALTLAWRAAVEAAEAERATRPRTGTGSGPVAALSLGAAPSWRLKGLSRERLAAQEAVFAKVASAALRPEQLARALDRARLDLLRLELSDVAFDTRDQAEEAELCVAVDGEDLEAVAARAGRAPARTSVFAEELPGALRSVLLSRRPGDLAGPIAQDARFHLLRLDGKTEPALDDPRVEARLKDRLLRRAYQDDLGSRVRWGAWRPVQAPSH